ncbi:MAG TPA: hypothetical protein VKU88_00735 [Acidimicrobiales bacterium]|nr:hypothetical protein [Acidimicrobiales bacterium]
MSGLPRLRQVALAATELEPVAAALQGAFGWDEPFHDPGVGQFGLENAVFTVGDTFVEVVSPVRPGTTAGRYLDRRGGDSGYMAIFQVADLEAARRRIAGAGIKVVWQADYPDIAGTHLHPKDVPGAIVSVDWADPPESWRWAGPEWTGKAPARGGRGIAGIVVEVEDPAGAAARWATAIGVSGPGEEGGPTVTLRLDPAGQIVRFVPLSHRAEAGIVEVYLRDASGVDVEVGGVRFVAEEGT